MMQNNAACGERDFPQAVLILYEKIYATKR